jgi:hypothetical protein
VERAIGKKNDDYTLIVDSSHRKILRLCEEQGIPCVPLQNDRSLYDADLSANKNDTRKAAISAQERRKAVDRRNARRPMLKQMERERKKVKAEEPAAKEDPEIGKDAKEQADHAMTDMSEHSEEDDPAVLRGGVKNESQYLLTVQTDTPPRETNPPTAEPPKPKRSEPFSSGNRSFSGKGESHFCAPGAGNPATAKKTEVRQVFPSSPPAHDEPPPVSSPAAPPSSVPPPGRPLFLPLGA